MAVPVPQKRRERIGYQTLDVDGYDRAQALAAVNALFDYAENNGYTDVQLDWSSRDYEDGYEYTLRGDRMETQQEALLREAAEAQRLAYHEQAQRRQYEALKAKFG